MLTVHKETEELFSIIKKRKQAATRVFFIGNELTSCLASTVYGKEMFKKYFLGAVGVFDKKIKLDALKEDIEKTKQIIRI